MELRCEDHLKGLDRAIYHSQQGVLFFQLSKVGKLLIQNPPKQSKLRSIIGKYSRK